MDHVELALPREAKPESVGQSFRRGLNNTTIDPRLIYAPLACQGVAALRCRRLRVQLKRRQNRLMMSVWYRRRAGPLAWICLPRLSLFQTARRWLFHRLAQDRLPAWLFAPPC